MRKLVLIVALFSPLAAQAEAYIKPNNPACSRMQQRIAAAKTQFVNDTQFIKGTVHDGQSLTQAGCLNDILGLHVGFTYVDPMGILQNLISRACAAARNEVQSQVDGMLNQSVTGAGGVGAQVNGNGSGSVSVSGSDNSAAISNDVWRALQP